jgi:hypothetical protein
MSGPAARVGDLTAHGCPAVPGIGSTDVFIAFKPAWRALEDRCACPAPPGAHGPELALMARTERCPRRRMPGGKGTQPSETTTGAAGGLD